MKVIDLLVKISKGEEVPKKIKFNEEIYKFNELYDDYEGLYGGDWLLHNHNDNLKCFLNDEVEIIEEEKAIEKIKGIDTRETRDCIIKFQEKFNELIDVINDMRDKEC